MSYLLQGSSVVGPALTHLLGKEMAKYAPCVCVRCASILSSRPATRGKDTPMIQPGTPTRASMVPPCTLSSHMHTLSRNNSMLENLRNRYPNDKFSQKYFTTFATSLPHLGHPTPVNVNVNFSCAPDIMGTSINYRFLHNSQELLGKPSSKVEETVMRLKEKHKEAVKIDELNKKIENVVKEEENMAVKVPGDTKLSAEPVKKGLWVRFVDECKHYYSGFKLLFLDVKVSSLIIYKVLQGKTLSRRENRQLVRTVSDLFRLVPFSVFIIIPFMELLLPIALKMFPGMLPSTFTSQNEREVKMRRALKAKLEYAKFLQQTLDEMGPKAAGHSSKSAADFVRFYDQVKAQGADVSNDEILKYSKLFEDEITLDNMTRGQLSAICRLLDLTPFGTNAFLRFQIEMTLRKLRADDAIIHKEGVDSLTMPELQQACKERGMRALGMTTDKLQQQLKQWMELSMDSKVPPSLLLLSRTLYLPQSVDPTAQIAATISTLPPSVAIGAKSKIGEMEGKVENVTKLEVVRAEQAKIDEEAADVQRQAEIKKKKEVEDKVKVEQLAQEALERALEDQALGVVPNTPPTVETVLAATGVLRKATVTDTGEMAHMPVAEALPAVTSDDIHVGRSVDAVQEKASDDTELLTGEDLEALRSAIETISSEKGKNYIVENEVLTELKRELSDYEERYRKPGKPMSFPKYFLSLHKMTGVGYSQEDLGELTEAAEVSGRKDLRQTKGAARLFKRVNKMLNKMDNVVHSLEDRERRISEMTASGDQKGHLVSVQGILQAVRGLQDVPDSARLERISEVVANMDDDVDGSVKVDHVYKVVEIIGRDNLNLTTKQVKQIIDLVGKEEMIETEARVEKILGKLPGMEASDEVASEDVTGSIVGDKADELLVDSAPEMNEGPLESHIQAMFSDQPMSDNSGEEKTEYKVSDEGLEKVMKDVLSKTDAAEVNGVQQGGDKSKQASKKQVLEDNSVKDVSDILGKMGKNEPSHDKDGEEQPMKVSHKNGSKH